MMKLATSAAVAATLLTAAAAHADDGGAPKSEDTALNLSLAGTGVSVALTAAGFASNNGGLAMAGLASSLVTPSLGEWYAGKPLTLGMGVRAASAVTFLYGVGEAFKCFDYEGSDTSCHNDNNLAGALLLGGALGYAGGTIYDIATAKSAAREYNAKHGLSMTLAPTALRTPSGQSTMGVGIGGSF
jgi:hypothetical protein